MAKKFTRDTLKEIRNHILQRQEHRPDLKDQSEVDRIISIARANETPASLSSPYHETLNIYAQNRKTGSATQMPSNSSAAPEKKGWNITPEQLAEARAVNEEYKKSGGKKAEYANARARPSSVASSASSSANMQIRSHQNVPSTPATMQSARSHQNNQPSSTPATAAARVRTVTAASSVPSTNGQSTQSAPSDQSLAVFREALIAMKSQMNLMRGHNEDQGKDIAKLEADVSKLKGVFDLEDTLRKLDDASAKDPGRAAERIAQLEAKVKQCGMTIHDLDQEANGLLETVRTAANKVEISTKAFIAMQERVTAIAEAQKKYGEKQEKLEQEHKDLAAEQKKIAEELKKQAEEQTQQAASLANNSGPARVSNTTISNDQIQQLIRRIATLEEENEVRRNLGASLATSPFTVTVKFTDGDLVETQTFAQMTVGRLMDRALRIKGDTRPEGMMATLTYLGEGLGHTSQVGQWDIVPGATLLFEWK